MTEIAVHLRNGHSENSLHGKTEPKQACNCCPYGYHIDLDFVRFCEKLAKASGEPSPSKKLRRERRRQRQSMEVLLGLTNPIIWNIEQLLPTITQETFSSSDTTVPAPIKYSPQKHSNAGLNKAVSDFEATLERASKKKKKQNEELDSVIQSPVNVSPLQTGTFKREVSPYFRSIQDMSPFSELEMISMYSSGGGTSPGPLQNIREQMAISLKRMRELEDKVKLIPTLEVEVHSLKNEKNELLEKLNKLKSLLKETENHLNEFKKNEKKEISTKMASILSKPILRDIGITCAALTRDVGINPTLLQKSRSIGTETVAEIPKTLNGFIHPEVTKTKFTSTKCQVQPQLENQSTITELYMKDITKLLEKKEKKLAQKDLEAISFFPRTLDRLHKGIQATIKEPTTVLKVIEKRETGIQVEPAKKLLKDSGCTVKPKTFDTSTDARPRTREYGSSDDRVSDVLCDKCKNLKTRSIGIGLGNVLLDTQKTESTLLNRSKSFQISETKPKIMTRSVGVGTMVPVKKLTSSKGVGTQDYLTINAKKSIGINTKKIEVSDIGVGSTSISEVKICEKCKGEPKASHKSPQTNLREIGNGQSKESQPSKIPRPKSNQTTPVMERKKFIRQDTYTKLPPQSPFDTKKKTKPGVKTALEKLESPSEEKVEVALRKKVKPTTAQSPSSTEKSLSKDLKDLNLSGSSNRYSGHFDDYYFDYDESYDDDSKRNSALFSDNALFQPIHDETREKIKPSKEMKAAMKVVNDSLSKYPNGLPKQLKNASNIIQQEWFKISSTASANPLDVEDYLDSFEEVSSTLLEYIVNMVDNNGNTAMHYAVSHGNFDVVSILLDSKVCNINKMNAAGYTCIMLVSLAQVRSETHHQVVKRLFQLADVNIRAKQHGQTALMLAVSHGRLDMVKLLLEAGADPNIQDGDGSTALMCAAEHGHLEIVKHIIAHPECDTSIVDCDGSTALAIAMEAGNRDIGVLLYAREHFSTSRGSSPYTSLKQRKSKSSNSPHPRTPTSPNPNRKSDHSV